jgi:hypothetical protein
MRKLTFYCDPGHGWLRVPINLIKDLGIQNKISQYSYMNFEYVYLEEDLDATTFFDAFKEKYGSAPKYKNAMSERPSKVRSYARYDVRFIEHPIKEDTRLKLKRYPHIVTVKRIPGSSSIKLKVGDTLLGTRYSQANILEMIDSIIKRDTALA